MSRSLLGRFSYAKILIKEITATDFKLRYNDSILGYVWSALKPLALFSILYVVFTQVFRVGDAIPHYPAYLLLGIVMWSFFTEVTSTSLTSVVDKGDLLRKINFPKYVIVFSKSTSALINLVINLVIVAIFMLVFGSDVSQNAFLFPLLVLEFVLFALGVSLWLSALYVRLRDLGYIWEVVVQALFYATPILYPLSFVVQNFSLEAAKIMMLNPIAQIIQDSRQILVTPETTGYGDVINGDLRIIPVVITLIIFVSGLYVFRSQSKQFAELV